MATASFRDIFLAGGDRNINAETSVSIPKDLDCPQVFLLPQDQFSLQPANGQTQRSAGSSFKLSKAHKKQQRIFPYRANLQGLEVECTSSSQALLYC